MKHLSWQHLDERVRGSRICGLWYSMDDGHLRIVLEDGTTLVLAASWEGIHIVVDETLNNRPALPP
jgi:hypothetical protein